MERVDIDCVVHGGIPHVKICSPVEERTGQETSLDKSKKHLIRGVGSTSVVSIILVAFYDVLCNVTK